VLLHSVQNASLGGMDESTGGEILRGDSYDVGSRRDDDQPLTRADIAPSVLRAVEQLAQGFDLVKGRATVELPFEDGLFETGWLHRRLTLKRLDEFEPVCRETAASTEPLPSERAGRAS
jgi:hypothetical protein